MRKGLAAVFLFLLLLPAAYAAPRKEPLTDPEAKAEEIHRVVTSDIIYTQDVLKALYYQNLKIIDLLKEIRDLLQKHLDTTVQSG